MLNAVARPLKISLLALALSLSGLTAAEAPAPLKPTTEQQKAAVTLIKRLTNDHYRKLAFDDNLSSRYFDEYFKSLDSSKNFFLQSDIDEFEPKRKTFDNEYTTGNLNTGFAIFNRYNERVIARLEKVIKVLEDPETKIDLDEKDQIESDRKNAAWPKNEAEADALWMRYIKSSILSSVLGDKTKEESISNLIKRYNNQLRRLRQQTSEEAYSVMMNSLANLYDPHTSYLSPENAENFDISMSLELQGIGAVLQMEDDYTKVSSLIFGGPAQKQGILKPNDKIIAIAQGKDNPNSAFTDVVGWRLDEVVKLIRGKKDSYVQLEVIPANPTAAGNKTITIKRETVKLEDQAAKKAVFTVKGEHKEYKIGLIDIPTFYMNFEAYQAGDPNYRSTTRDVLKLLEELQKEKVDGVIIDLRDNGGGSLPEAAMLTDLFVDPGPVVQIRHSNNVISRNYRAYQPALYRAPMVVLVNRFSASASEIFAGAIQDYGRGIIVGTTTFGKGTVQTLFDLKHGRLKITEAKFYRISGETTQHRGVVPDVNLPSPIDPDDIGESSYDNALPWDQIHAAPHTKYHKISQYLPKIETKHQERLVQDPEFVYINQQSKLYKEAANKPFVSLNIGERKAQQADTEKQLLSIENQRRKAQGKPLYENYEAFKTAVEKENEAKSQDQSKDLKPLEDPYVMESGHILADFMDQLLNRTQRK